VQTKTLADKTTKICSLCLIVCVEFVELVDIIVACYALEISVMGERVIAAYITFLQ